MTNSLMTVVITVQNSSLLDALTAQPLDELTPAVLQTVLNDRMRTSKFPEHEVKVAGEINTLFQYISRFQVSGNITIEKVDGSTTAA